MFYKAKEIIHDKEKWLDFRNSLALFASLKLRRQLEVFEKDILLFPRVCEVCGEAEASRMIDCSSCHAVFYCSDLHRLQASERHGKLCESYLLAVQCYVMIAKVGVIDLPIPNAVDTEYKILPASFRDYISSQVKSKITVVLGRVPNERLQLNKTNITLLSDRLSFPLSLLYALQHLEIGPSKEVISQVSELNVHVVGAVGNVECLWRNRWEYMVHRLPALKKLHIVFIGPDVFRQFSNEFLGNHYLDDGLRKLCVDCRAKNRMVTYEMCQMLYHDYVKVPYFTSPDVIIAFNCGFHEYQGEDQDTWQETLSYMTKDLAVPLIFTSYGHSEAKKDLAAIKEVADTEVIIPSVLNPYHSLRPVRDAYNQDDCDLFFQNQYLTCVKGKLSK